MIKKKNIFCLYIFGVVIESPADLFQFGFLDFFAVPVWRRGSKRFDIFIENHRKTYGPHIADPKWLVLGAAPNESPLQLFGSTAFWSPRTARPPNRSYNFADARRLGQTLREATAARRLCQTPREATAARYEG